MSLGVLIFSPRIPTRAARQRQEARLSLGIDWTTAQQVPLPIGVIKFMTAQTPSVAMLKTQVATLTGAGAGLGADCADARAKRSRLKQRKRAAVARDFPAIFLFEKIAEKERGMERE